jgi:hypothetical protein
VTVLTELLEFGASLVVVQVQVLSFLQDDKENAETINTKYKIIFFIILRVFKNGDLQK